MVVPPSTTPDAKGDPAQGDPAQGDPAQGDPAQGDLTPGARPKPPSHEDREEIEVDLLVESMRRWHGLDFRDYSRPSLVRRLWKAAAGEQVETLSGLQEKILHDPGSMGRVLEVLSVHVTAMFRDPSFYRALREHVLPRLATYPHIRVWVAGCSSGEEAYSIAILLKEEGLLDRSRIYATDMSPALLDSARDGVLPLSAIQQYTRNYIESGGQRDFSDYYTARYERVRLAPSLQKGILFTPHNLVTDASFNEFHLILCRNVMIYFNPELQARVHNLLFDSLRRLGMLCLGRREMLRGSPQDDNFVGLVEEERIFQRTR